MLNLGDEQTSLTPSISSMQSDFSRTGSEENLRTGHLNLLQEEMAAPYFYFSVPK